MKLKENNNKEEKAYRPAAFYRPLRELAVISTRTTPLLRASNRVKTNTISALDSISIMYKRWMRSPWSLPPWGSNIP